MFSQIGLCPSLKTIPSRKRMEKEMADNLEESRLKQQAKFKERLIRMTPAWRALNYSTEEDLALRVAARREEERMKKKRYDKLMGSIYGRVHQMPPLFQRQSGKQAVRTSRAGRRAIVTQPRVLPQKRECEDQAQDCKQKSAEENGAGGKSFAIPSGVERYGCRFRRSQKSSESSGSHEKSDGSKIDESDNETGSREDEMEDYPQERAEGLGRTADGAQKGMPVIVYDWG